MKQITEDYVSNEVGKLLEEKGFDWQQSPFYSEQDMDKWKQENSCQIPNPDYDPNIPFDTETITVVAQHISQSLALKWLREVHKLFVKVNYTTHPITKDKNYYGSIINMKDVRETVLAFKDALTYESCVNSLLKYALEKLI